MLLLDAVLYGMLSLDLAVSSSVITLSLVFAFLNRCCFDMKQISKIMIKATRQPENTPKISASFILGTEIRKFNTFNKKIKNVMYIFAEIYFRYH